VKLVDVVFVSRGELAFDAGVVEEAVDLAEDVERRLDIVLDLIFIGAVCDMHKSALCRTFRYVEIDQPTHPLLQSFAIDVDQHDARPLAQEYLRGGEADAARRTSDDDRVAFVAHHFPPLRNGSVSRNQASFGVSSLRKLRASSGVSVAAIGIVPKTLPLSTRLSPWRSTLVTCISSDLSAA